MNILNRQILTDIANGVPLSLNLGSGGSRSVGVYGVDMLPLEGVDIQADLNEPLVLLPDNSVERVTSNHTLEHISNLMGLLGELHRLVRPEGQIRITVPHFSSPQGYSDPTHVRFFGLYTMLYFADEHRWHRRVPNFYSSIRFDIESVKIQFDRDGFDRFLGGLKERVVNLNVRTQACYERHFCWMCPAGEVTYIMRPKKISATS